MIEYQMFPTSIILNRPTEVLFTLTNSGSGVCTNIQIYLYFPKEINLIEGLREIKISRLWAGEQKPFKMKLIGKNVGPSYVELTSLSYIPPEGEKEKISAKKISLQIQAEEQQNQTGSIITLSSKTLNFEQWNLIEGTILWYENRLPEQFRLTTSWPLLISEAITLSNIDNHPEVPFRLAVQPKECGEHVPVKFSIAAISGVLLYEQTINVKVQKESLEQINQIINIRESNVTIADKGHIQQEVYLGKNTQKKADESSRLVESPSVPESMNPLHHAKEEKMNPIDLIITAITAGVTTGIAKGTAETVTTAIKDLYSRMKTMLEKHTAMREDAKIALSLYEKDPGSKSRKDVLLEELVKLEVERDQELIQAAQAFLQAIDTEGKNSGKYVIDARYSTAPVIGENNIINQTFYGEQPKQKK